MPFSVLYLRHNLQKVVGPEACGLWCCPWGWSRPERADGQLGPPCWGPFGDVVARNMNLVEKLRDARCSPVTHLIGRHRDLTRPDHPCCSTTSMYLHLCDLRLARQQSSHARPSISPHPGAMCLKINHPPRRSGNSDPSRGYVVVGGGCTGGPCAAVTAENRIWLRPPTGGGKLERGSDYRKRDSAGRRRSMQHLS